MDLICVSLDRCHRPCTDLHSPPVAEFEADRSAQVKEVSNDVFEVCTGVEREFQNI